MRSAGRVLETPKANSTVTEGAPSSSRRTRPAEQDLHEEPVSITRCLFKGSVTIFLGCTAQ